MNVFNEGVTKQGIQESILYLQDVLCPTYQDLDRCKTGIANWWGRIAQRLFTEKNAEHVCQEIESNCIFSAKTWDCDTCLQDVLSFAKVMTSESLTEDLVYDLAGHNFCQSEELALDQSQIEDCQSYIKDFLPKALHVLFSVPSEEDARGTCTYYFDLCF